MGRIWHPHARSTTKSVCVEHRTVNKPCCDGEKVFTGYRWRPPKKTNDRAWKRIESGDWMWENDPERPGESGVEQAMWRHRLSNPKHTVRGEEETRDSGRDRRRNKRSQ